jgi:hypothetical protein
VTEEAFEVKYTGRRLPYTTERPPIGLRILPRLRPVTQITISAPHDESRSVVPLESVYAVGAMEWRTSHTDAEVAGKCCSSAFIARTI